LGLAHNGKKIIGLAHNGKKILGIAHNGNIIWRYLVATKLWTSANDSYLIDNLQLDDKGLLYMIDTQSINRVGKNDGNIYATIVDVNGICGDLTFNTAQNSWSYIGKTDYWNKNNYSDLTGVHDGQGTANPVDVTYSKYQISNYNVTLVTYPNGYVDIIDNSNMSNSYPINHATNTSLGTFYLQALDSFGNNSNCTAGDFLAYNSTGSQAYNASSSTALDLEGTQASNLESATKISYAPIGYDDNKVNYYLSNQGNNYTLFSATKSNSIVNLIYLTYSTPAMANGTIETLVTDYDAYNNLVSNVTKSKDGSNSSASMVDVPAKFTSYGSEKDSSGNSHIYALNYNANSDWTKINKEKLVDLDAGWNVKKMVKNGNMLYIGENYKNPVYTSIPWKFTADDYVYGVAVDNSGNVYAGTDGKSVYKLDSTGKQVWKFTADNYVHGVAVDNSGNVYAGIYNFYIYKLDSTGKQLWKFTADDYVYGVAVDNSGNVYAGTGGKSVYKLDSTGKQVWKFTADDYVNNVAVDNNGNVYAGTINKSVYKLTPDGSNTATYTKNQSRIEAFRIDKLTYSNLMNSINLSTNDPSGNIYQPNSIAVSASNFAVASNATSANRTLLRSMCVDGNIYTDQSNTGGAQSVCGVPYDNSGAFVNENGKLSYRKYSDFGTLVQYYSNSAIKGTDPLTSYMYGTSVTGSTGIDWASDGNLYFQNLNNWDSNYSSGYTDNTGDIAMAPIKGAHLAYLIHPSTSDIKVFDTNSLSITKTLPQYHLSSASNGTSDTIAVAVDGTICYGTKNKDAQTFFFENPDTGTLFINISFNSGYYLLDIASDSNNNFAVLYYNSSSKQVAISWYTSKGKYISTNTFSGTYDSLPYGKIEIDPQNGNVGLIRGNNYSMWIL
jgi:tartrate dehydratase beta subunit/fumarate hydratase class I family protein